MVDRLACLDPRKPSVAITAALGSFHTVTFVLVALGLLYLAGDLGGALDGLNTLAGLGLFAYLWLVTWVTTAGALRRLGWPRVATYEATLRVAVLWGGVSGSAIFATAGTVGLLGFVGYAVLTTDLELLLSALIALPFVIVGATVAFLVGAAFGSVFGVLDYLLIVTSMRALRAAARDRAQVGSPRDV